MIDRRNLLRGAMLGAGASAFSGRVLASANKAFNFAHALPRTPPGQQVLFVFLRGGNDGVNTLIPHQDATYATARPTLKVTNGFPLSNAPYSRLNPNLERLLAIDEADHLAMIHQVGDSMASRSHFTAMDMFEKALDPARPTGPPTQTELAQGTGFLPKMLKEAGIPAYDSNHLPTALSLSLLMQTMFGAGNSNQVSAHVRDLETIGGPQLWQDMQIDNSSLWHGVNHHISPNKPLDDQLGFELVFGHETNSSLQALNWSHQFGTTGRFPLTAAELTAAGNATGSNYVPAYNPGGAAFMKAAEQAVFTLVKSPNTRVVGIEIGGWDTHADQDGDHPNLLRYLGWALRDIHDEIQAQALGHRITVVAVSEFGRTAYENGSSPPGTDHGAGGVYIVIEDKVNGGTYNIHGQALGLREYGAAWRPLTDMRPTKYTDAVEVQTELRDVLAELMVKRVGVPFAKLPMVMPNYPTNGSQFLGYLQ